MKPLFKWTGSKRKMMDKFGPSFWPAEEVTTFVDGFYGAGSVTCAAKERFPNARFIINDVNNELVSLYKNLASHEAEMIERSFELESKYLEIHHDLKEERKAFYNKVKLSYIAANQPFGETPAESSKLLFMLKINFNGWWKTYNYSNGRYATPPGTVREKKSFLDIENLKETASFFRERCSINDWDFRYLDRYAGKGTYFYFDPPYRDSDGYEGVDVFSEQDQIDLLHLCDELDTKGSLVSYSNKDIGDGFFQRHIPHFEIIELENNFTAQRKGKRKVTEVFIRNFFEKNALFT